MTDEGMRRLQLLARVVALCLSAAIVFVTLGPVGDRPQFGHPQFERFGAYLILAAAFALGFPRHRRLIAIGVVVAAIGLELAQLVVPGRDAGAPDAAAKALGGVVGVLMVWVFERLGTSALQTDKNAGE